jgi:hypothetical protein
VLACTDEYKRVGEDNLVASLRAEIARITAERDDAMKARDHWIEEAGVNEKYVCVESDRAHAAERELRLARAVVDAARALMDAPDASEKNYERSDLWTDEERAAAVVLLAALSAYDAAASAKGGA